MGVVTERFLICDSRASADCHGTFGVDTPRRNTREQRGEARKNDWKSTRGGRDYCPACIEKRKNKGTTL